MQLYTHHPPHSGASCWGQLIQAEGTFIVNKTKKEQQKHKQKATVRSSFSPAPLDEDDDDDDCEVDDPALVLLDLHQ